MIRHLYDLETSVLLYEAPQNAIQTLDFLLEPRRLAPDADTGHSVSIRLLWSDAALNKSDVAITQSALETGSVLDVFDNSADRLVVGIDNRFRGEFRADGNAIIRVRTDQKLSDHDVNELIIMALDHCVNATGQSFVHAACLATPDRKSAVLLHAKSGTGKTTTAFAMLEHGYKIISDDAAVLRCPDEGISALAWGVPRSAKVHKNSVAALPWLQPLASDKAWDSGGEQFLARDALAQQGWVLDCSAMPVRSVIALQRKAGTPSDMSVVPPFEAISDLLEDNISSLQSRLFPSNEQRLSHYAQLVQRASCYRVNIGGTPQETAALIAEQLADQS